MEGKRKTLTAAFGAALFFVAAPGVVAGLGPYLLTRWQPRPQWLAWPWSLAPGAILIAVGGASLVESFVRFVVKGRGAPAPVAPPDELVVSGQYRLVRNPMYVAVVAIIIGEAVVLGRVILIGYAAAVWLMFHVRVLTYEEPRLRRQFGTSYDAYSARVRRWMPRLRSRKDA